MVSTLAGIAGKAGKAGKWAFFRIWLEKLENHMVFSYFGWKSWNFDFGSNYSFYSSFLKIQLQSIVL